MIHYHGTPIGGPRIDVGRFLAGRNALVPFSYPDDLPIVADQCKSFILDNGAFTAWRKGGEIDFNGYVKWISDWCRHPGFDWCIIPDVIDGDESSNDDKILQWNDTEGSKFGMPVWHLHESIERLERLSNNFRIVCLGSSGAWSNPGSEKWWNRMSQVMDAVCINGIPPCKFHGLRMLDPEIFTKLPLSSADSTNAAVNSGSLERFGMYRPPSVYQRATVIADRVESFNSAPVWVKSSDQKDLFELV